MWGFRVQGHGVLGHALPDVGESARPLIKLKVDGVLTGVGGRQGMDEGGCVEGLKAGAWLPPPLDA